MAALVLRIKFPPTYPLIYKTLRIDANLKVTDAIIYIAQTLNIPSENNIGLYLPDDKKWLDDNLPLSAYDSLQDVVCFFFVYFIKTIYMIRRNLIFFFLFRNTSNIRVKIQIHHHHHRVSVSYCDFRDQQNCINFYYHSFIVFSLLSTTGHRTHE